MSAPPSPPAAGSPWRAFTEPEALILAWHRSAGQPRLELFALLAAVAVAGTAAYGALLAAPGNPEQLARAGGLFALAAALSWLAPLPAVYILNSMAGARLRASTTFLAALLTAAWGGLGFLSLLPVAALVLYTFASPWAALAAHLLVIAAVGLCMAVMYARLQAALEPTRGGSSWWLWLCVLLMVELLYVFGLVRFTLPS
jgi:hypothetical protein